MTPRFSLSLFALVATTAFGAAPSITVNAPPNNATGIGASTSLDLTVTDPEAQAMTVTFYGRKTTPAAPGADFLFGTLPDTQYYSQNTGGISSYFHAQTQWYATNRVARNLAFVSHMGDFVQTPSVTAEWQIADAAMARIENRATTTLGFGIPWGGAPGNHDIVAGGAPSAGFNTYFGESRFTGRTYYRGHLGSTNDNNYEFFSASGLDFMVIHLTYQPTDAQIAWADALIAANPNRRAIVTSHEIIGTGNPGAFRTRGLALYNAIKDNPNLFLLLCGHVHGEGRRTDNFVINGVTHTVTTVLQDFQDGANGGNGFFRLYTFSPATNTIRSESYSPTLGRAVTAADGFPGWMQPFDIPYNMQSAITDWIPLGTVNVPAGGSSAVLPWTGLETDAHYEWYAAASDGGSPTTTTAQRFATIVAQAPTVALTAPANNATFTAPATVAFAATADDADGTVARVEFFQGSAKLGEDTSAPYAFSWTNAPAGTYALTAVAVDNAGLATVSGVANVTVTGGGTGGSSATIPLAENFNAMGASGTTPPSGWSIKNATGAASTWASSIPSSGVAAMVAVSGALTASNSPTSGNINGYNTATSGSTTDRVLSTCPTGNNGSAIQLQLTNTTGAAVAAINVGYDIYRDNASSGANELPGFWLFYSLDDGASWTNVAALNPVISGTTGVVVPNTVGATTVAPTAITLTSSWAAGGTLLLRWVDDNANSFTDQVIGLDNVAITAAGAPNNLSPTVALTAPANNATFTAPVDVALTAGAGDSDGTIAKVEFYAGAIKLGEDLIAPYAFTWSGAPAGNHTLTARATDDDAATTISLPVAIIINAAPVSVPNLVGQTQAQAVTALQTAGLVASVGTQPSAVIPLGQVLSQNPAAGALVVAGTTVNLVVSSGVTVPSVVGQTQSAATTTLTTAGFAVTTSTQASGTVAAGSVISQDPAGGASASGGSTVALVISNGAPQNITLANPLSAQSNTSGTFIDLAYTVPNLAGQELLLSVQAGAEASITNRALPVSATFNGRTLTRAGAIRSTASGSNVGSGIFWLPVTAGETGTIRITFTGTCQQRGVTAVTLVGAALSGPTAVETAAGTSTLTDQIATTSANAMVISAATQSNTGQLTATGTGHIRDLSLALSSSRIVSGHAESATPTTLTLGYSGTITRIAMVLAAYPVGAPPLPPIIVPDVVNALQAAAESTLLSAGLQPGAITTAFSATVPAGYVISQNPAAGASVTTGTSVALLVSLGVEPPNQPPTVALTAPADNSTFTAPASVALAASANDLDGTIVRVEFYAGATKLGEDLSDPYAFTWINAPAGIHTLTAVATDNDGAPTSSTPIAIVIAPPNVSPTVALTAPADNASFTAPVDVALTADAGDSDGTIAKVEFFAGATKLGEDTIAPYEFTWLATPAGSYALTARATDDDGAATTSAAIAITVNGPPNFPPTVALTAPADGVVFTAPVNIDLTADAGDTDGTVAKVEFFAGATKLGEDLSDPYAFTWTNAPAGSHTLTARVTDNAGAVVASAPVAIVVNPAPNVPPTVALATPFNNAVFTTPTNVTLTATAGDTDGTIAKVEFFSGATKLGEDTTNPYAYTWNSVSAGNYTLTAAATDNRNATTISAPVAIIVNTPPTVALSAPTNNATFTTPVDVTLTATAGDTDGTVALVEFYSGATRLGEDATAPYAFTWLAAPVGAHALTARATDNRGALTASTAVSITITSPTPAGLVAAYAFNEGSGTTTADATGKGHTGTINSAAWITTGKTGNALNFAGTARVTVADAADLDFTTAFTISTWVYPTQQSGWASLVMKETSGNLVYALYSGTDGNLPVGVFYSGDYRAAVGPSALPLNTWTHLATTYDGTTIRLFVNGAQVASSAYTGAMGASTGVLSLGGNGVWGEYFRGRLDDVRLYNRALTAAEIGTDMNTPVTP